MFNFLDNLEANFTWSYLMANYLIFEQTVQDTKELATHFVSKVYRQNNSIFSLAYFSYTGPHVQFLNPRTNFEKSPPFA